MADNLNKEEEDLLQSALSDAFSPPPVQKVSVQAPQAQAAAAVPSEPAHASSTAPEAPAGEASGSASPEEWKVEYDEHVTEWRARNAEQRQKAEAERAKWEALRKQKESEGVDWKESILEERRKSLRLSESTASVVMLPESGAASVSGWESVGHEPDSRASPSIVDTRDLTAGERPRHIAPAAGGEPQSTTSSPPTHSRPDSEPDSSKHEKWEEIPSDLTSSFPSMTIPSDPHSPTSSHRLQHSTRHHHTHGQHEHHSHQHDNQQATATAALFDTRLSAKTRTLALLSSLAINLFLPFVNGVMLGFGEIFAKRVVVGWLGWKIPGSTAANVGVRARTPWKS